MLLLENDQQFSDSLLWEQPLSTGFLNCPLLSSEVPQLWQVLRTRCQAALR